MKILLLIGIILTSFTFLSADLEDDFIQALTSNKFEEAEAYYSPELANAIQKGKLEVIWKGILRNTGDYEYLVESKREERDDFYSAVATLKFVNVYMDVVMTVNQENQLSGLFFRPSEYTGDLEQFPTYVDNDKFIEEDVQFDCQDFRMYGTLTVPKNQRAFPIVIMATGSGPNDRDEKIGANKPFKNIAQGLASVGVASLRYDKRTYTYKNEILKKIPDFNIDHEYTQEVSAAIDFLEEKYAGRNIYYLGHSMGAFMVPRVLNKNPEIRGAVMLAANARPLEDLVLEQTEYIMVETDDVNSVRYALIEKGVAEVKKLKDLDSKVEEPLLLGLSKDYWLSLNQYSPLKEAKKINSQVLVLQGERDYQVTMEDYSIWFKKFGNNKSWRFQSYPDLNHLFMSGQGKSLPKEYMQPGFVAEKVVNDIARFINSLEK